MVTFLFKHGQNQWNYLPEEGIAAEFQCLNSGEAIAFIAEDTNMVGFAISLLSQACPEYLWKYTPLSKIMFIADVVVGADHAGKGIGSELLKLSIAQSVTLRCESVFIERHEENLASAAMMNRAGFTLVETFYDPGKRHSGSQNSSILKIEHNKS